MLRDGWAYFEAMYEGLLLMVLESCVGGRKIIKLFRDLIGDGIYDKLERLEEGWLKDGASRQNC